MRYNIKIEIAMYEDSDEMTDVMRVAVSAQTEDKTVALAYLRKVQDQAMNSVIGISDTTDYKKKN